MIYNVLGILFFLPAIVIKTDTTQTYKKAMERAMGETVNTLFVINKKA